MNYPDFLSQICHLMEDRMGSQATVSVRQVLKNNSLHLDGLLILHPGENIAPTIYLNNYYKEYINGMPISEIVREIGEIYESHRCPASFDVAMFQDFERIRPKIAFRLINRASNLELLEDIPYLPFLDLAIVFYFTLENDFIGSSTALVHKKHMELWETTPEELYSLAYTNTRSLFGCKIQLMEQIIREMLGREKNSESRLRKEPMDFIYILSNYQRIFGSACILYSDVLKQFSEEIQDDFYILPSSIHETILIPYKKSPSPDKLQEMVHSINLTEVPPEEFLSDNVYLYHADNDQLGIVFFPSIQPKDVPFPGRPSVN